MPIASGANPWPKSYWTKPEEKQVNTTPVTPIPTPRRLLRAVSIAEGSAGLVEKRRRFVKQRSVPVTSFDATLVLSSSSSTVFVYPHQLTTTTTITTNQAPPLPAAEAGDWAVWEEDEEKKEEKKDEEKEKEEKEMKSISGSTCNSSSIFLRSNQRVEPWSSVCPSHQESIERHRLPVCSAKNEEDEDNEMKMQQTEKMKRSDGDGTIRNKQHTLSIMEEKEEEDRGSVDYTYDRWRTPWCREGGEGRGGEGRGGQGGGGGGEVGGGGWRRGKRWWRCLVVLMSVFVLTTTIVIALTLILMKGGLTAASNESVIETSAAQRINRAGPWHDDVYFDGNDDDDVELYFKKLSQFGKT